MLSINTILLFCENEVFFLKSKVETRYEAHVLNDERLPFVFHRDTVKRYDGYDIANWHRNIEILFFTDGSGTVVCDANTYDVIPGDIIVINSNNIHYVVSENMVRYYCLIVDADFCGLNGVDTDEIIFSNHIKDEVVAEKFKCVVNEYACRSLYYNAGIRSSVLALLVHIARNYTESKVDYRRNGGGKSVENIKLALGFLKAHYTEALTIDDIATEVGLSKYHFSREFKKITGISPINYINMLRCEKAKRMLISGGHTVSYVQESCGFENASYFSKVFKRFSGTTPAGYAEKTKK